MQDLVGGQLAFPLAGDDKASFENFWVGENNELVAALKASANRLDSKVIYLYGPNGCGKSHLLFAVMRLASDIGCKTSYLCLNDAYVTPDMLGVIDASSLVCVDDAHAWAADQVDGSDDKERALFTLFEQIKHAGGQLIVSARQAPEIEGFALKDLVSRLSSGLIYAMLELNDEQQFHALKMRANHRGLTMNDDVLKYLVTRVSRDTSDLFVLLDKMDKASLVEKRKITIPFLQALLAR